MTGHVVYLSLPDDLAAEISAAVGRGEYASESDAVLGEVEDPRRLVQEGIESGLGRFESFEDIRAEARRRFHSA